MAFNMRLYGISDIKEEKITATDTDGSIAATDGVIGGASGSTDNDG